MNKSYKSVWNESTGTYVAASEVAKSQGKKSRNQKALVAALLAAGIGFGAAVTAEAAATPNSYAAGVLGTNSSNSDCISSADGAVVSTGTDCSAPAQEAGIVSYDASGNAGAYFTVTDPNTAHIGAGGVDQLKITQNGLFVLNGMDMGGFKITNLAPGAVSASSKDAVNGSQLYTTNTNVTSLQTTVNNFGQGFNAIAFGAQGSSSSGSGSGRVFNTPAAANGLDSFAIGGGSSVSGTNSIAVGAGSYSGTQASAVGSGAVATSDGSTSVGYGAGYRGIGTYSSALGWMSQAAGNNAVALGANASATANNSVAVGNGAVADRANTVSMGTTSSTRQVVNVAAGTQRTDAVNYGQLQAAGLKVDSSGNATNSFVAYDDTTLGKATLGGASGTTLANVAAGALSASSTDAVNGSQLYTTNQNVAQNASEIAQNTSDIAKNAGDITSIDSRVTNVEGSVSNITNQINSGALGLVQQDQSSRNLTVGATTDGLQISMAGTAGNRVVTAVAAGAVGASSVDAVNGSQLYTTNQTVAQNTSDIATNAGDIAQNTSDIAANKSDIAQNTSDIAKNAGDITNIDARVTNVEGSVTNLTDQINSGAVGLVQQDPTSGALTVASSTGGTSVDFTGTAGTRELLGVSAGRTATSAVNLGQLSPVVSSLGGGAQVNADGSITSPTYHMQGGTQTTVGGALDTLDTNLSSLESQISNGSIGVVTQDQTSRDINVGSTTDGLRVNMAGTAGNRVVTGVAAGAVSASSVDAVNGGQLYAHAASTAAALGGGSTVNADGTVSAPSYSVGGTTVNNVGAAVSNLDGRVTQNTSDIASLQTTVGTMSGSVANAVSYDSSAHDKVTLGGSSGAPAVKLTNLQQGEVSASSTDAVTGAQLWDTNQQLSNLTQSVQNQQETGNSSIAANPGNQPAATATGNNAIAIGGGASASGDNSVAIGAGSVADQANTVSVGSQGNERRITNVANARSATDAVNLGQMQSSIGSVARAAYGGVAAATALTMIPEVDPGKTLAVGVAGGTFKGYQATAVGVSARITQNLKVKAGVGMSPGETTAGIGASYQW